MKIVVFQDYLRSGGTESQSVAMSDFFARAGHEVVLLTMRPGGVLTPSPLCLHISLQRSDCRWNWFAPRMISTLRALAPDIVLCMGFYANLYASYLQGRFKNCVVIGTVRTLHKMPWWLLKSWRGLQLMISNSESGKKILVQRHRFAAEKIKVIPNARLKPVDVSQIPSMRVNFRKQWNVQLETKVLLCVAMFRKEKNQEELIRIVSRWRTEAAWQLWLAGDGATLARCRRLAEPLGEKVRFFGHQTDLSPFYAAADVAVLTSQMESLPNFLCEAQSYGLPVVAYDVGGVRECFLPEKSGLLVPYPNQERLRECLSKIVENENLEKEMSAAAQTFARARFSPASRFGEYLELFENALAAIQHG
ncbi:MAG: glycosyltransferase family 4 protein [bacterium]